MLLKNLVISAAAKRYPHKGEWLVDALVWPGLTERAVLVKAANEVDASACKAVGFSSGSPSLEGAGLL